MGKSHGQQTPDIGMTLVVLKDLVLKYRLMLQTINFIYLWIYFNIHVYSVFQIRAGSQVENPRKLA